MSQVEFDRRSGPIHAGRFPILFTGFILALFLSHTGNCDQPNQLSITHKTVSGTGDNWGFETGTLQGWKAEGDAFQFQPTFGDNIAARIPGESSGASGAYWIGTYEMRTGEQYPAGAVQGDAAQGSLTSTVFVLQQPTIRFLIGGGYDEEREYVALVVDGQIVLKATGYNGESLQTVLWDARPYLKRQAQIRIVDASSEPWGHINCDAFEFLRDTIETVKGGAPAEPGPSDLTAKEAYPPEKADIKEIPSKEEPPEVPGKEQPDAATAWEVDRAKKEEIAKSKEAPSEPEASPAQPEPWGPPLQVPSVDTPPPRPSGEAEDTHPGSGDEERAIECAASWDFETGDLQGWTPVSGSGTAFSNQPVFGDIPISRARPQYSGFRPQIQDEIGGNYWDVPYSNGHNGNYWIGTYDSRHLESDAYGSVRRDDPQGVLASPEFTVTERTISFLIGGGGSIRDERVELQIRGEDFQDILHAYEESMRLADIEGQVQGGRRPVVHPVYIGQDGDYYIVRQASGAFSEMMRREVWDVSRYRGRRARILIIDRSGGPWGHINADDFVCAEEPWDDPPLPLWGFADLHAHWMSNLCCGGSFFHGSPGGNWRTSDPRTDIPPCGPSHQSAGSISGKILQTVLEPAALNRAAERIANPGLWPALVCVAVFAPPAIPVILTTLEHLLTLGALDAQATILAAMPSGIFACPCLYAITNALLIHYNNTIPSDRPDVSNFIDYPHWNSMTHQQMHITWVRRAYEGGLRLMVIHATHARMWEYTQGADGDTTPPLEVVEQQIRAVQAIAASNPDWLEVARSPEDARRIIRQNKLALVIGVEQAEIGNYFEDVNQEVNHLYDLGVRHVFPIHNINNRLGGSSLFKTDLHAYNFLVNNGNSYGVASPFRVTEGSTGPDPVGFHMESRRLKEPAMVLVTPAWPAIGGRFVGIGSLVPFLNLVVVPSYASFTTQKNADGLTDRGRQYIRELMRHGMVIDVDHMSDLSQEAAMQMLEENDYPAVSSHSNFRDLRRDRSETSFKDDKIKTEFTITRTMAGRINDSGGMFGIMSQQNDIRRPGVSEALPCAFHDGEVCNDSSGSSKSWAQAYLYALEVTGGQKGIGFGTDANGFAPQVAPRFGTEASQFLDNDEIRNREQWTRHLQVVEQTRGVQYDAPIRTYHYHRFPKTELYNMEERDIWEAIAIFKSGVTADAAWQPDCTILGATRTAYQCGKIRNLVRGFRGEVGTEGPDDGDWRVRSAANLIRQNAEHGVPGPGGLCREVDDVCRIFHAGAPIYHLWQEMENGPNPPLRRSYAGSFTGARDFDFNLDGFAHYGMFPDFIQDLRNDGLTPQQIAPIFKSAEEYIETWEKSVQRSGSIH